MGLYVSKLHISCLQDLFAATYDAQTIKKRVGGRWGKDSSDTCGSSVY